MANSGEHRKILGRNIRACRESAGLTLEKVAEKADMSWPYLSEIERGKENISIDKVAKIATALGVTISDLVRGI